MKRILILSFLISLFTTGNLTAQQTLQTEQIFETYGKQEGAILIELSTDILAEHTNMKVYKSFTIASRVHVIAAATAAIKNDIQGGSKLMETRKNGRIETGYYCLKRQEDTVYEYILYKEKSKKMTLIYIRGYFPPRKLESELNKLKDLFIYVNNKRIKLQ
ncbi:MAG: hypothetical protein LBJ72_10480 [Dysgonamonadaceae bacterium]|jgi:hypothetical protein|nr:hypothetical protein [Dysgonamonadaceae bacterium]